MTLIIDRNLINSDIKFYSGSQVLVKSDLVDMIRYWKILLHEKYCARAGMKIGIAMSTVDPYQLSLIFAAAELGLQFVLLDHPISEHTLHRTKAALFAPIDIGVYDHELSKDTLHQQMMEAYCTNLLSADEFDSYVIKDPHLYNQLADKIFAKEDDVLIWASTSGTTTLSSPVPYTHKYTHLLSIRNSKVFNYTKTSNIVHTRNMHHASSLLIHFFPTIYASTHHWSKYVNYQSKNDINDFVDLLVNNKINFAMMCNHVDLKKITDCIAEKNIKFAHQCEFNISGEYLTNKILSKVYAHNLRITSTFGSVDTAVPLLIHTISSDTTNIPPYLIGKLPNDGFFSIDTAGDVTKISCNMWSHSKILSDTIELKDGEYFHVQRKNVASVNGIQLDLHAFTEYVKLSVGNDNLSVVVDESCIFIVLWDTDQVVNVETLNQNISNSNFSNWSIYSISNLEKQKFIIDTKINMDQLRAYLKVN